MPEMKGERREGGRVGKQSKAGLFRPRGEGRRNVRVRVRVNRGAFLLRTDDGSTRHVMTKCPPVRSCRTFTHNIVERCVCVFHVKSHS